MTFNTGNNVPSTDPRDLYDNAENLDKLVNGVDPFYADRKGKLRESWAGMENSFTNAQEGRETAFTMSQADKESRFQAFLVSSGYVSKGDYAANVVLEERNEYVAVDAATTGTTAGLYRPGPGATLPLTLTGTWATDETSLVLLGDDVLRQELADASGAEMVGFKSPLALAVSRSAAEALQDVVSIREFGQAGAGDPSVDTAALQAAVNSGAKGVYLPSGKYRITQQITCSGSLKLYGDGPANSKLCFESCDGFSLTPTDRGFSIIFDGVGVLAASRGLYTAVSVDDQNLTRRTPAAIFRNCAFTGADVFETNATYLGETATNVQEWRVGLNLISAWGALIEHCTFVGKGAAINAGFDTGTTAIVIGQAMHATIQRCFFSLLKYGITIGKRSEGFHLLGSQFVGLYTGLTNMVGVGTNTSPNNFVVDNSHFDTTWRGVEFGAGSDDSQVGLCAFSNILFLRRGETLGYAAMDLLVNRSTITNNVIQTNGTTADYIAQGDRGVIVRGVENIVANNVGRNCGYLVELTSSSARNNVVGNSILQAGTATTKLFLDAGTSNVIGPNLDNTSGNLSKHVTNTNQRWTRGAGLSYLAEVKSGSGAATYDARLEFTGGDNTDGSGTLGIRAGSLSTTAGAFSANIVRPNADNVSTLGTSALRWSTVYAGTGSINTSDERQKQQIRALSEVERAVAVQLKGLIRAFKFSDAVEAKGDGARIHFGVIAQDVKAAFEAEGLVAENYALLCYDEWPEQAEVLTEDGEVVTPYQPAGNRYGVRYEELLAFIISAM